MIEERAAHRPPLVSGVGVRLPSHLTATGRAILSALPRNQVRALYPNRQAFTDRTGIGPKSPKELEATLAETQRTGFAEEHGDVRPALIHTPSLCATTTISPSPGWLSLS